jgi:hypothetical protein
MAGDEQDIRRLVSRLQIAHFKSYLLVRGWEEKPSRYVDHLYFEGEVHGGGSPYELYLPESSSVPRYHTRVMRAIYKLCGIEEREPDEIVRDLLASTIEDVRPAHLSVSTRLRVQNSGSAPLQVKIDSPRREHKMMPGEAIELNCEIAATGSVEIEHGDALLSIFTSGRK